MDQNLKDKTRSTASVKTKTDPGRENKKILYLLTIAKQGKVTTNNVNKEVEKSNSQTIEATVYTHI
jgi:hypothetical protein